MLSGESHIYTAGGAETSAGAARQLAGLHAPHAEGRPPARMAIQHYQFEAIHPFACMANGRTGRILNILFLVEQGLLDSPILDPSRYIIREKADYYRLLL
ncbi:MAG: Fic family protein [Woeseiaceae bacterium]|nr:Fic family protein [Woeseiaceae bacterium]